jgi:hypothetical protein
VRHEPDLDHRPQPGSDQQVVHAVDAGEVVHRRAVALGVDAEVVVQDRVRAYGVDAHLGSDARQRGEQFGADLPATADVTAQQLRQALTTDHRLPRPVQRRPRCSGVKFHVDRGQRALFRESGRGDGGTQRTDRGDLRHRRDRVRVRDPGRAGRVDVPGVGHRQHVTTEVIDGRERRLGARFGAVHQIADRARNRLPRQANVPDAGLGPEAGGRFEIG